MRIKIKKQVITLDVRASKDFAIPIDSGYIIYASILVLIGSINLDLRNIFTSQTIVKGSDRGFVKLLEGDVYEDGSKVGFYTLSVSTLYVNIENSSDTEKSMVELQYYEILKL